jgi:hypothetical protein
MNPSGILDTNSTTMGVCEDSLAGSHALQSNGIPISANILVANLCASGLIKIGGLDLQANCRFLAGFTPVRLGVRHANQ